MLVHLPKSITFVCMVGSILVVQFGSLVMPPIREDLYRYVFSAACCLSATSGFGSNLHTHSFYTYVKQIK
jgi:uncharacterized membrane protein YfcA